MRIVNNHQVTTAARQVRTNAHGVVHPTFVRVPPTRSLTVHSQLHIGENLLELVTLNQVLRLAAKINRQLGRVRRLNDLHLRITAHHPRREQIRRKFRLRVTRSHVDNDPLQLTTGHALKLLCNDPVMTARDEVRPNGLHER